MSVFKKVLDKIVGDGTPPGFTGTLETEESVVVAVECRTGGHLVVTSLGLWVPTDDGPRRVGWHLISKVTWGNGEPHSASPPFADTEAFISLTGSGWWLT